MVKVILRTLWQRAQTLKRTAIPRFSVHLQAQPNWERSFVLFWQRGRRESFYSGHRHCMQSKINQGLGDGAGQWNAECDSRTHLTNRKCNLITGGWRSRGRLRGLTGQEPVSPDWFISSRLRSHPVCKEVCGALGNHTRGCPLSTHVCIHTDLHMGIHTYISTHTFIHKNK